MKTRFLLTSSAFTGQLTFVYNENEVLTGYINDADMTDGQFAYLFCKFPFSIALLEELAKGDTVTLTRVIEEVTFDQFYETYGYKMDRQQALKAWEKLSAADQIRAYEAIPAYNHYLLKNGHIQRLYPASYLNGRKFENDYKALAKPA